MICYRTAGSGTPAAAGETLVEFVIIFGLFIESLFKFPSFNNLFLK